MSELLMFMGVALVYFIPVMLAYTNDHHNANAIALFNLLLGWTVIGWIVAIIWAYSARNDDIAKVRTPTISLKQCPFCAEDIKREAKVCRFCGRDLPVGWSRRR